MVPLIFPPTIQPRGHRTLEAVNAGFQSAVPRDLPPPFQSVLQVCPILNTTGHRGSLVGVWKQVDLVLPG